MLCYKVHVKLALALVGGPFLLAALAGMLLFILLFFVVGGYFFARFLVTLLGLHSPSPEQLRGEFKLIKFCSGLLVFTIFCTIVAELLTGG
jgi:hypothetical protein